MQLLRETKTLWLLMQREVLCERHDPSVSASSMYDLELSSVFVWYGHAARFERVTLHPFCVLQNILFLNESLVSDSSLASDVEAVVP